MPKGKFAICGTCGGHGTRIGTVGIKCPICKGKGTVWVSAE